MKSDDVNRLIDQRQALEQPEQQQKTPLKVLNLTVFTENRLRNGRVYDVETLQAMTNRDILAIPDMGKKALKEVLEALDAYAIDISEERVEETAKREHDSLGSEWVPCVKLPVIVHVRNQRDGETHISTREGITPVLPEDLIMRGVAGEEYPIGRELFERTYTFDVDAVNMSQERVDETAKGEHEPVAWLWKNIDGHQVLTDDPDYADGTWTPLYTAPPKKEWVGLTDEDLEPMCDDWRIVFGPYVYDFARAIETKLKEKNT